MAAHEVPYAATASVGHLADLLRKVEKAKAMHGTRIITLLIPCLDGWGLPDDAGLTAARYAVECGAFPLYEVEDGRTLHAQPHVEVASGERLSRAAAPLSAPDAGRHRSAAGRGRRRLGKAPAAGRIGQAESGCHDGLSAA